MRNSIALLALLTPVFFLFGCDQGGSLVPHQRNAGQPEATPARTAAEVEQGTNEVLREVERLTQTYDNLAQSAETKAGHVYVPAGSNDALAGTIAQAGAGGRVVLAAGAHHESQTVAIPHRVTLVGEPGATLIVDTQPRSVVSTLDPALHVIGASRVVIWGIEIEPKGEVGGTAILAERSPRLVAGRMQIRAHQVGVALHQTDHARLVHNSLAMSSDPSIGFRQGVLIISGAHAMVASNTVSNATVGFFVSDEHGRLLGNEAFGNLLGFLICKPNPQPAPNGDLLESETTATKWLLSRNDAHANGWGYLFINGANDNLMAANNRASNNASYDIELAGATDRFGPLYPTTFENTVVSSDPNITIKDCGIDNRVVGGTLVDTDTDPCF
jgi:hypothetical protein